MTNTPTHPSATELAAYGLGQLAPEAAAVVEKHVDRCVTCCETIAELSVEDTFIDLLQDAKRTSSGQTEVYGAIGSDAPHIPAPLVNHSRYDVSGLIGKGGMGDVYRARHRIMNRTVALKVIKQELVCKPEAVDRFQREVTAAAKLSHPNIVTAFDAEQAGDVHFLVMEYVDGIDLAQTIKGNAKLSIFEACDYVRQAALGLQHAHEQGMVHRDIKPHNLMVTNEGIVKILDFGLASLAPQSTYDKTSSKNTDSQLTIAGSIMGTPDFISPEQTLDAHQVDGRSDIYSLGMTLYFLLSSQVPFNEGSARDKLRLHAESHPVRLSEIRSDVPNGVQKIFDRMTAKDPNERFQSPQDVADAIDDYFGKPPTSNAGSRIGFSWRPLRWLIAGVILMGSFGLFVHQNPNLFSWRVSTESDVHAPISELRSYIAAMVASPHDLVFMNVYELGPDNVALGFKKSKDGFLIDIDVSSSGSGRTRGKYANRMKEIAASLSTTVTEEAKIAEDGAVAGVNFSFCLTGPPIVIADNAFQIVTKGLTIDSDARVMFQCRNFPSHLVRSEDYAARCVSSEEFVAEYEHGDHVFLGEIEQNFFLVPAARRYESPLTMNDEIWFTDVRNLPFDFATEVRLEAANQWQNHKAKQ